MTRVLHVIETPGTGGAERVLVDVATSLGPQFTSVGATLVEGWTAKQLRTAGVDCHVLPLARSFDARWPLLFSKFLKSHRIDVVHTHEFTSAVYCTAGARFASIPVISTIHGKNYWPERAYRRIALRMASRSARFFVTVSDDLADYASQCLGIQRSDITVVRNGIDLRKFSANEGSTSAFRREISAFVGDTLILAIGALDPVKGHSLLINAVNKATKSVPSIRLAIVGNGDLYSELRDQISRLNLTENVRLLGWRDDIPSLLSACDFTVLPSYSEGMPLAVMESMACGRAVIATRVGGTPSLIDDGRNGLLISPGSVDELSSAIIRLASDKDASRQLGAAARQHAADNFSLAKMSSSYEALYNEAIKATSGVT